MVKQTRRASWPTSAPSFYVTAYIRESHSENVVNPFATKSAFHFTSLCTALTHISAAEENK